MSPSRIALAAPIVFAAAVLAATFGCEQRAAAEPERGARATQEPRPGAAQPGQPVPDAVRVLVSGSMLGRLEPCGCASGQLGGLARRVQHIGEQRTYDLLLEGGDLVGGGTELDVLKLLTARQVLVDLAGYDVLGVGPMDLEMPRDEWSAFLVAAPIVATNLTSSDPAWPAKPYVDKEVREQRVRVASLLLAAPAAKDAEGATAEGSTQLQFRAPEQAWQQAMADAGDALRIVMLHGGDTAIRELLPKLEPRPDLAIGVDAGYVEPTATPIVVGDVPLVFAGIRGRVLLDVRLWRDGERSRATSELVPLAGSKTLPGGGGDPQVRDLLLEHRRIVDEQDVLEAMARKLPTPNGASYVGTATCRGCHPTAYEAWAKSAHGHAWQTLVDAEKDPKRYGWPVTAYPDCVSCHVVGYRQETGFVSFADTPELADVGCERCHGPGSGHVAAGGRQPLGIIGGIAASVMCTQCHDFEQSPDFEYVPRWAKIAHGREPSQQK